MSALSPEEVIARLRGEGMTTEEIVDQFARVGMAIRVHEDGSLEWVLGSSDTLYQRRIVREWLERTPSGQARDDVTSEDVIAERDRRVDNDEPSGYDALARHFNVDASTIRRRLGKLPK